MRVGVSADMVEKEKRKKKKENSIPAIKRFFMC